MDAVFPSLHEIEQAIVDAHGFLHLNGPAIFRHVQQAVPAARWHEAYCQLAQQWLMRLRDRLGGAYRLFESEHFLYLSFRESPEAEALLAWAGQVRRELHERLGDLAWRNCHGKHVILDFEEVDDFDAYLLHFPGVEQEFPFASGVCLRNDYVHIALNTGSEEWTRVVICHEMTHDLLSHLQLPQWIEEGLARIMEDAVAGRVEPPLDVVPLVPFYRSVGLERFWTGTAFYSDGDDRQMWYRLAELFIRHLNASRGERFDDFVQAAKQHDSGDWAARHCLGLSLCELATRFLGPGDWAPSAAAQR